MGKVKRYILAIDGGGIRGIIASMVLAEIERRMKRPIAELFDMVAGTSTGAIVAVALCKLDDRGMYQYSAKDMIQLYREQGPKLFDTSFTRKWESMCCCSTYSATAAEHLGVYYFGDAKLGALPKYVLIPSYDMILGQPLIFKSWIHKDVLMRDCCEAATAAPTYFPPKKLVVSNVQRCLVDGGVFAVNPSACAFASAKKLFPDDDIIILSVGCGKKKEPVYCDTAAKWGKINWIMPIIDLLMHANADSIAYQLQQFIGENYVRIEPILDKTSYSVDDASKKNLKAMTEDGNATLEYYDKKIEKFCKQLSSK